MRRRNQLDADSGFPMRRSFVTTATGESCRSRSHRILARRNTKTSKTRCRPSSAKSIGRRFRISDETILRHYRNRGIMPFEIAQNLSPQEYENIKDALPAELGEINWTQIPDFR